MVKHISSVYLICIVLVENAHLKNNGGLIKPHPYVELCVDDIKRHKTEVIKNSYQPKWNEEFTMYLTILPTSL